MSKAGRERAGHQCVECGWQTGKWVGRCGQCQAWGTVEAVPGAHGTRPVAGPVTARARPIVEVPVEAARARPTGVAELDRVLGGGLVPGAVALLAGEPGVGKSTLLLDVAARAARQGCDTLYVTGEESAAQVRLRADRINAVHGRLWLAAETDLPAVLGHIEAVRPQVVVLDSVQTVASCNVDAAAGSVAQVRAVGAELVRVAKERDIGMLLVGHVTKDGSVAGPRLLEHLVDVVLNVEGDRTQRLRMVRALKNRFGPTEEVGCFELSESGIASVPDPSGRFLTDRNRQVPGTCVTVALEGRRPLMAEVQALVTHTRHGPPRRATTGLDAARTAMVLAVLARQAGLPLEGCEVYAATVGGVVIREPSSDLALVLALASSLLDRPLPADLVAIGEVGLAGEVRPVPGIERRLAEAARFGFTRAIVPAGTIRAPADVHLIPVTDVCEALRPLAPELPASA